MMEMPHANNPAKSVRSQTDITMYVRKEDSVHSA